MFWLNEYFELVIKKVKKYICYFVNFNKWKLLQEACFLNYFFIAFRCCKSA